MPEPTFTEIIPEFAPGQAVTTSRYAAAFVIKRYGDWSKPADRGFYWCDVIGYNWAVIYHARQLTACPVPE